MSEASIMAFVLQLNPVTKASAEEAGFKLQRLLL